MDNNNRQESIKSAASKASGFFRLNAENTGIEVDEGDGNAFHLGPVLRKYTSAKLSVKPGRRTTAIELPLLWDALGLLRSLQYDAAQFNAAANRNDLTPSEVRYACYRMSKQASAFGVRVPRAGTGTVEIRGLNELVSFVEEIYADEIEAAKTLIAGGVVDFNSLGEQYKPGRDMLDRGASTGLFGVPMAMRVRAGFYSRGKSLFGVVSHYYAALEFVVSVGDKFAVVETHFPFNEFQGTRSTSEGVEFFVALTESVKAQLVTRGQFYSKLTSSTAFLQYLPGTFLPVSNHKTGSFVRSASRVARGGGRIMIDGSAAWARGVHCARSEGVASEAVKGVLKLAAQRTRSGQNVGDPSAAQSTSIVEEESLELLLLGELPSHLIHLTWPVVAGFSFQAKSWGVVMASGLREVKFNSDAFQRLVMPPTKKKLIEALVSTYASSNKPSGGSIDVIQGKGEGAIFLLHGPPGVGKTLTAEAIAELLQKPLYVVSMGELGTTPEVLEDRLLDIFDLCVPWGALVLIDEAELLLERRAKNDVLRNAMVCVMLRLLEYYSGILFLTTNRIESLDPAFQSRVQCALRYDELDVASREKIWRDLLGQSKVELDRDVDFPALSKFHLNGRQIRNAIQLGIALSRYEKVKLSHRHLAQTVGITAASFEEE